MPFAILKLNPHQRPPANYDVIAHGDGTIVAEFLNSHRTKSIAAATLQRADSLLSRATRADADAATATRLAVVNTMLDGLSNRLDTIEQRRAIQARRAADAERQRIVDELEKLPDPDNPDAHFNTGDLHSLPPSVDAAIPGDPSSPQSMGGTLTPTRQMGRPSTISPRAPVAAGFDASMPDPDEPLPAPGHDRGPDGAATLGGAPPPGRVGY